MPLNSHNWVILQLITVILSCHLYIFYDVFLKGKDSKGKKKKEYNAIVTHLESILSFFSFLPSLGLRCCWGLFSSCDVWASHCTSFSCCGARALEKALVVAARGL